MEQMQALITTLLLATLVIVSGVGLYTSLGGDVGSVPGYNEGQNLSVKISTDYAEAFKESAEGETSFGVAGLVKLIKDIVLGVPGYFFTFVMDSVAYFNLPQIVGVMIIGIIIVAFIIAGILLLRGITG
jgi:hypothetical protein